MEAWRARDEERRLGKKWRERCNVITLLLWDAELIKATKCCAESRREGRDGGEEERQERDGGRERGRVKDGRINE